MHIYSKAFTMIELIIAITIIGILSLLTITISESVRTGAKDQERLDDVSSIIRRLEQMYIAQESGAPSYPSTVELLGGITNGSGVGRWVDSSIFKSPDQSNSSVIAATSTSLVAPAGVGQPTKDQYVYQPFNSAGALCTSANSTAVATDNCVRFIIYYRTELDNAINKVVSFHQQ